ncbi:MAG: Ku protein [Planctomycetes bacterium]|nr:Ku protein [Planctomycetota bacterium]MCB9920013.1 Ku protein [Planctomycetota bacterium]
MPPRSSWKGFLKLSLVSVPVKAYSASSTSGEIRLNQLHKDTMQRIRYLKVVNGSSEPVPSDDIVSGYEYAKGQYVVIDPQELDKLRTESDRSITIDGFVAEDTIDPIYLSGKSYYLVPDGPVGQKPYLLMQRVLEEQKLVGIAKVVLSGREQLVMLRPIGPLLCFEVLNQESKIKSVDSFRDEVESLDLSDQELELTRTLVDATKLEEFDYSVYEDDYVTKLSELIRLKVEGQEIVQIQDVAAPQVLNFMEALKQSVAELRDGSKAAASKSAASKSSSKPSGKMAASARRKRASASKSGTTKKAKKAAPRKKKSG